MGCVDRYQICTSDRSQCTGIGGVGNLYTDAKKLDLTAAQAVTTWRLLHTVNITSTFLSVFGAGTSALKASDRLLSTVSPGLPPNQWQIEVQGWFETTLAKFQAYAVEYAKNQPKQYLEHFDFISDVAPLSAWQEQCASQRIHNPGQYQNFSLLGLLIITIFGGLSFLASTSVSLFRQFGGRHHPRTPELPRRLYEEADNMFHLQRMAFGMAEHDTDGKRNIVSEPDELPDYSSAAVIPKPTVENGFVVYHKSSQNSSPVSANTSLHRPPLAQDSSRRPHSWQGRPATNDVPVSNEVPAVHERPTRSDTGP